MYINYILKLHFSTENLLKSIILQTLIQTTKCDKKVKKSSYILRYFDTHKI